MNYDAVVIGGGQAGLASGYWLRRAGSSFLILDRHDRIGGSWPSYYDSLSLFSPARYSALPGMDFPGRPGHYPPRDEVAGYLAAYAERFSLPLELDSQVVAVERMEPGFRLGLAGGGTVTTRLVIAATGSFERPHLPELPGAGSFAGEILHSGAYRSSRGHEGRRIVVVGAGDSAVQIAVELAQVADVTLATRSPIRLAPQRTLGLDMHFWLKWLGTDRRPIGGQRFPVVDTGGYRAALRAGRPDRRPMFKGFTPTGVEWSDGSQEAVDVVVLATGYGPNLDFLAGLDVTDEGGRIRQRDGISTAVPGLGFVGYEGLRNFASGTLRGAGVDARIVVSRLTRSLNRR